jgi:hypothetical protein
MHTPNRFLLAGAAASAAAALVHFGCIVFGASWYRFLGAGEGMARMAERGERHPALMAAGIGAVLLIWALYALSGAGVLRGLPLLRTALCAITAVYLLRGVAFVVLLPRFPGNSLTFWLVSSGICLAIGILHAIGLRQRWSELSAR